MKRMILTAAFTAAIFAASAQRYGETFVLRLWDNSTAPHSNCLPEREDKPDREFLTTDTELYVFAPDSAKRTDMAVVICPGGGYYSVAMKKEGCDFARLLADNGITAAVLKYRMPNGHPEVPLEDAVQALRIMRGDFRGMDESVAQQMKGLICSRVGMAGFSAGGHLAAYTATAGAIRPDFSILFYPVITGETGRCHAGSFDNLLGRERSAQLSEAYWLERRVDGNTPPAIIFVSDDDRGVPPVSSTRYYDALKQQGKAASLHIYPAGGHGWGMLDSFEWHREWRAALFDWLGRLPEMENQRK